MWERGPLNYAVGKKGVSITSAKKPYQVMKTSFSIGGTNDDQNDVWSFDKIHISHHAGVGEGPVIRLF